MHHGSRVRGRSKTSKLASLTPVTAHFNLISMTNLEIAFNVITCIIVTVAMVVILTKFLKRLKQIEIERWGDNSKYSQDDSMFSAFKWILGKKKKLIKGEKVKTKA